MCIWYYFYGDCMFSQKYLIRENYLEKVRSFYDVNLIKVILGIRRSGKTILLNQIMEELKANGVDSDHIIYINFDQNENYELFSPSYFNEYIRNLILDDQKYYLFFDEIENVVEWEKTINSFRAFLNVSIFITGSNHSLLTDEFVSYLSGRYVLVHVLPYSFKEVINLKKISNSEQIKKAFDDYLLWGGMPQRFLFQDDNDVISYLEDLFYSIIYKDILLRNNVVNVEMLNYLTLYLVSTPSQTFSGVSISKYFEGMHKKIPLETLYNYFSYIVDSFMINKVARYDIKAKKLLSKGAKYYLTDLGLGHIVNKKMNKETKLENIVYNELVYRGYTVYVGKINSSEIDFIAIKKEEKMYIQVCEFLNDQNVIDKEFGILKKIQDNYPKYVLSMDQFNFSRDGIIHKNIIDWLLDK